jgi:hypothetical protein
MLARYMYNQRLWLHDEKDLSELEHGFCFSRWTLFLTSKNNIESICMRGQTLEDLEKERYITGWETVKLPEGAVS